MQPGGGLQQETSACVGADVLHFQMRQHGERALCAEQLALRPLIASTGGDCACVVTASIAICGGQASADV